jgi:predicted ATP-grasp superfamily ATP-dependent carboligase
VKIRQFPQRFGECSFGRTTARPDLVELASRLVAVSGLSGIAQLEFLEHDRGMFLIEINPRLWSWHEIHAASGRDLVRIATTAALDEDPQVHHRDSYRTGVTWQFAAMDVLHHVGIGRKGVAVLISTLSRDREAFWNLRDPKVFVAHLVQTLRNLRTLVVSVRRTRTPLGIDGRTL